MSSAGEGIVSISDQTQKYSFTAITLFCLKHSNWTSTMKARPRLVQEGQPILGDSVNATNVTSASLDNWPSQHVSNSSLISKNKNHFTSTSSCPQKSKSLVPNRYKLQTRLTVGGDSTHDTTNRAGHNIHNNNLTMGSIDHDMMMDDEETLHVSVANCQFEWDMSISNDDSSIDSEDS